MFPPPPIPFPIAQMSKPPIASQKLQTQKVQPEVAQQAQAIPLVHALKSAGDIPALKPADVLIFLAHPDDDNICAGSILALRNKGYTVQLVYATVGENGRDVNARVPKGPLMAEARKAELVTAVQQLKIDREPVALDAEDGKTSEPDNARKILDAFTAVIQQIKPRLVITFGPDGVDGHPDHRCIGNLADRVTQAFNTSQPSTQKARLFHMALSSEEVTALKVIMNDPDLDRWQAVRMTELSAHPAHRLVRQDIGALLPEKVASLCMYRTQFSPEDVLKILAMYRRLPWESFIEVRD